MIVESNLRDIRKSLNMTQKDLAMEVGISRRELIEIELQRKNPSLELALRLAGYLKKPVTEVFWLKENE